MFRPKDECCHEGVTQKTLFRNNLLTFILIFLMNKLPSTLFTVNDLAPSTLKGGLFLAIAAGASLPTLHEVRFGFSGLKILLSVFSYL